MLNRVIHTLLAPLTRWVILCLDQKLVVRQFGSVSSPQPGIEGSNFPRPCLFDLQLAAVVVDDAAASAKFDAVASAALAVVDTPAGVACMLA